MATKTFEIGDHVAFITKKRRLVKGVIGRLRVKTRRPKHPALPTIHTEVAEVVPDDAVETGQASYYTVPTDMLELIGAVDRSLAQANLKKAKTTIKSSKSKRAAKKHEAARETGVTSLDFGDLIEVEFRGGIWRTCEYHGVVKTSGKIRFREIGAEKFRYSHPEYVRVKKPIP